MANFSFKLVIIGDGSVGKTSLIHRVIDNKFQDSYNETIGIDLFNHTLNVEFNGEPYEISLLIYDLGGQDYWKRLRADFYHRSKGIVLVYDVSVPKSFANLESWYNEAIENIGHPVPCIILGNKSDLENKVTNDVFSSIRAKLKFEHYLVSAKTGESVIEAFRKICNELLALSSTPE